MTRKAKEQFPVAKCHRNLDRSLLFSYGCNVPRHFQNTFLRMETWRLRESYQPTNLSFLVLISLDAEIQAAQWPNQVEDLAESLSFPCQDKIGSEDKQRARKQVDSALGSLPTLYRGAVDDTNHLRVAGFILLYYLMHCYISEMIGSRK